METEFDLRPYVRLLTKRWSWIIGVFIVAVVGAFIISSLLPKTYKAQVAVAIVRSRTDVSFDTMIQTLSEDQLSSMNRDANARRNALLGLVKSNDIAGQVLADVGTSLQENERKVPALLEKVSASSNGDLIYITVTYDDPEIATQIANVWAQDYERLVNNIYSSSSTGVSLDGVAEQVAIAEKEYKAAQEELESFLANNRIMALQRDIEAQEDLISAYEAGRIMIQSRPVNLQVDTSQQLLTDYYFNTEKIDIWLNDAETLRDLVQTGSGSPSSKLANALSLISLRTQVFGTGTPVQLQIDLGADTADVRISDVDALIHALETRQATLQAKIDSVSASLLTANIEELMIGEDHPINQRLTAINAEIMTLQADRETEAAHQRELVGARDLMWETYQTLLRKYQEVGIASQTTGTEVRLVSTAVLPTKPESPHIFTNVIIAGFLGLAMAVVAILATEWWRKSA